MPQSLNCSKYLGMIQLYYCTLCPQANVQLLKKGSFNRHHLNSGLACISLTSQLDVDNSCKILDGQQLLGRPMIIRRDKYEPDNHSYKP
jgi:hypothetical protein